MRVIAPVIVVAAIACGLVPLVLYGFQQGGIAWPDAYAWRVTRFTLLQAVLSTLLSVLPAIAVARALARQNFLGRNVLLALLAAPLALPAIVAVFGLTALYGGSGVFGGVFNLYGLGGIVLAHVFFNLPLATRLLLEALESASAESHQLAAQLNFAPAAVFRHVDWPALKPALPRVASLVFLLCASSFVIVLVLGGAQATTLEVAIYQSLRMDFDVPRALSLSLLQIVVSGFLVLVATNALSPNADGPRQKLGVMRFDGRTLAARLFDATTLVVAFLLVLPVLIAITLQGASHIDMGGPFWEALLMSFLIATFSSLLALPLAWGLSHAQARVPAWRGLLSVVGVSAFLVPPAVIATGWFLALRLIDGGAALAWALIALLNALMALPFALTVVGPALQQHLQQTDRLCAQLNITGINRLRLIDVTALRSPLAQAALMVFVLSMGDLAAVTLLGTQGLVTLPSLVQQQMGHYQSAAAGGTALILGIICLFLTFLAQRLARWT
jgi:thiamine transport system permease protein